MSPTGFSLNRQSAGDGDKKEFVAGEITKETVKTIARGQPGDFGATVVTTLCLLPLHRGCGCSGHPAFPVPSVFRGEVHANSGVGASRDRRHVTLGNEG